MTKIESEKVLIHSSDEKIFNFLGNFNNFGRLMPPQITNWKSTEDHCSFTIQGMTDFAMRIREKSPYSKILIVPDAKTPFDFELVCSLSAKDSTTTEAQMVFNASLNPMLLMIAKNPLQNLVNMLVMKLKEIAEAGFG